MEQEFCWAGSGGEGLLDNRTINEQSMEPAGHRVYLGPALPGRRVSRITEKAANGGQALTVEGRADVSSWSQSSRQQEEIKDFSNPHAVLWGWEQRRHWV